jgi:hypothetical protein
MTGGATKRLGGLGAALASATLVLASGCEDEATRAQAARAEQLKGDLKRSLETLEQEASDPSRAPLSQVYKDAAKARAIALELKDDAARDKSDELAKQAREGSAKAAQQSFAKLEERAKAALDKSEPGEAAKACADAVDALDHASPSVAVAYGKELDALRVQVAARAQTAKRAKEVLTTARQLKDESKNLEARAVCRSFDLVSDLSQSPFKPLVAALLREIPEKQEVEEFLTVFDGSDAQQIKYFTREHEYTWKAENNVLWGDNSEYEDSESTIWLGDDTPPGWSDLVLEVRFKIDNAGLNILLRAAKDENDKATTFDMISIGADDAGKGSWAQVRVVVKGPKASYAVNGGQTKTVDLKEPKGLLGLSVPGQADVKVQSVKIRLLDKDAKPPKLKIQEEQPKKEEDPKGKKKRKKHGGETKADKPADDEKKGDEKKGDEKKGDEKKEDAPSDGG